eukprot:2807960-Rhodomonas_salina.6
MDTDLVMNIGLQTKASSPDHRDASTCFSSNASSVRSVAPTWIRSQNPDPPSILDIADRIVAAYATETARGVHPGPSPVRVAFLLEELQPSEPAKTSLSASGSAQQDRRCRS